MYCLLVTSVIYSHGTHGRRGDFNLCQRHGFVAGTCTSFFLFSTSVVICRLYK